jgi:hypothetical protein
VTASRSVTRLQDLDDVNAAALADGKIPQYDQASAKHKYVSSGRETALRAQRALAGGLPPQRPGENAVAVSVSAAQPGSTPTAVSATVSGSPYNTPNTAKFSFVGGYYPAALGGAFPETGMARDFPKQLTVYDIGVCIAEFYSDAPALAIWQSLALNGTMRVLIDGVEQYRCGSSIRNNTAQAGAATTITLDAGASATNDFYRTRWVRITGGTGVGQVRQITGYVGATKVATVNAAWATNPDNTSTFEISQTRFNNNNSTGNGYVLFDYAGERRFRHYRVEAAGCAFSGAYVTGVGDTVEPATARAGTPTLWFGDSGSGGAGTDGNLNGFAAICCAELGWQLCERSIGGTGYLNPTTGGSANTLNLYDRLFPPTNAWSLFNRGSTAGTFTLTQGSTTTAGIAHNANAATVQSALDTAFGAGVFLVVGTGGSWWIIGRAGNAANATALTADFTGQTGGLRLLVRYTGEIALHAPKDGNGNYLPFNVVFALGHNDTVSSGYTRPALTAAVSAVLDAVVANYPMATIYVMGNWFLPGGSAGSDSTNANADIIAGCTGHLPLINGRLPYIDTLTTPWANGTGAIGSTQNNGVSDNWTHTDVVHPSPIGHMGYGKRLAREIAELHARQVV